MQQVHDDVVGRRFPVAWRSAVEALSIQAIREGDQFTRGVARQICALGQVSAQKGIGVCVDFHYQGLCGIGKEDSDCELLEQTLVRSPLVASIIGQRFPQRRQAIS